MKKRILKGALLTLFLMVFWGFFSSIHAQNSIENYDPHIGFEQTTNFFQLGEFTYELNGQNIYRNMVEADGFLSESPGDGVLRFDKNAYGGLMSIKISRADGSSFDLKRFAYDILSGDHFGNNPGMLTSNQGGSVQISDADSFTTDIVDVSGNSQFSGITSFTISGESLMFEIDDLEYSEVVPATPPTVTTASPTSITTTSATLGGNITDDGGATVTDRGIVYSTSPNPTTEDDIKVQVNDGMGSFNQNVTGLSPGTLYYVRAYAINSEDTAYGTQQSFTTLVNVMSINRHTPTESLTNSNSVVYEVNLTGPVSGLDTSNFSLTQSGGVSGASVSSVSGSGSAYQVTVNTGSNDGSLRLDLNNSTGVSPSITSLPFTSGQSYTIDKTAPVIENILRNDPLTSDPISDNEVIYTVAFSEHVENIATSDFQIPTGFATGTIASVSATSGTSVDVTVDNISGDGILPLNLTGSANITDQAGNDILIQGPTGTREDYTIDNTPPTITSITALQSGPTNVTDLEFDLVFSKNMTEPVAGDFTITNGSFSSISGSGTTWTLVVNPNDVNAEETITVEVLQNGAEDLAGNALDNSASTSVDYDGVAPTVTALTGPARGATNQASIDVTVNFSEAVESFTTAGVSITGGTAQSITQVAPDEYTVTIEPQNTAAGQNYDITIQITAAAARDLAGNDSELSTSLSVTFDTTDLAVAITSAEEPGPTNAATFEAAITFNKPVWGFVVGDINPGNGGLSGFTGNDGDDTFTVTVTPTTDGQVTLDVAADVTEDAAGNENQEAVFSIESDRTLPEIISITAREPGTQDPIHGSTELNEFELVITFTEEITNFDESELTISNATATGFTTTDNIVFIVPVEADEVTIDPKTVGVNIPQNTFFDHAANGNVAADEFTIDVVPFNPFAGGVGTEVDPYQIATAEHLDYVREFLNSYFIQVADIDLGVSPWSDGDGWEPIGNATNTFGGLYDGNGHSINNLMINRGGEDHVGLFGFAGSNAEIKNIGLVDVSVIGGSRTGGLIGESRAAVSTVFTTGTVSGAHYTGGVVGIIEGNSTLSQAYSTADVSGTGRVGGITGYIYGTLTNSYAAGGTVSSSSGAGGGLIGVAYEATISNTYAANEVANADAIVGEDINMASTFSNNFWDTVVTGQENSIVGTGLPSEQLKTGSNFINAGWDFSSVWQIDEPGSGTISYPYLQDNPQDPAPGHLTVTVPVVSTGTDISSITAVSAVVSGDVTDDGNLTISDRGFAWSESVNPDINDNMKSSGTGSGDFNTTLENLPPGTTIYLRAYATNLLGTSYGNEEAFETVKQEVTISGSFTVSDKVYNGDTTAEMDQNNLELNGIFTGHDVTLADIEPGFTNRNVGAAIPVSISSALISGNDADRYTLSLSGAPTATADITKRPITIAADNVTVPYGEADPDLTYEIAPGSLVAGDELSGELSRTAGLNVGAYDIEQGSLTAGDNYQVTYQPAEFEITPRPLSVAADANQSKTYGETDQEFTFVVSNFGWSDDESILSGELYRQAGEITGTYPILGDQLSVSGNYTIEYSAADFTIEPKDLKITADEGQSKIMGEDDPTFTFTVEGFVFDDSTDLITGELSRETGEETGDYLITAGTINAGENYSIVFEETVFSVLMTAPVAVQIFPADGEGSARVDGPATVEFDQPLIEADFGRVTLKDQNGVSLPIDLSIDDNSLIITHEPLDYVTGYQLAIEEGAVTNRDGVANRAVSSNFTTQVVVPEPVALQGPYQNEGSVSVQPELTWYPSENATHYSVQLSGDPEFGDLLSDVQNHTELSLQINEELSDYTHYYWRVQASNNSGSSEWSEIGNFVTVAKTPAPGFPAMMSEGISTAPVLQWTKAYSESPVRVQLSTSENFVELLTDTVFAETSAQVLGLEDYHSYYWRIRIESDQTTSHWSDVMQFRTRKAPGESDHEQVVENKVNFGHNPDAPGQNREITSLDYRLIGLPGSDNLRVDSFFDGRYGRDWKAFFDIGSVTEYYEEYHPDNERFVFAPGRGFWVLSKDVLDIELQTTSVKTNERDAYTIALQPGWNIISNPHRGVVSWSDVQELNNISGDLFGYEEQFISADSLYPVLGYYYYNNVQNPLDGIDIPYSGMEQRRGERTQENNKLSGAAMSKSPEVANVTADFGADLSFGVELVYSVPDEHRGAYKRPFPSLEMSRHGMILSDTEMYRGGYLRDETRFDAQGSRYELELKGKVGSTFNWKAEISGLSSSAGVLLVNPVTKLTWLLESGEEAEATLTESHTTYELYVGELNFLLEKQEELMPVEFALEQNYPNPFNPSTNIRYSIPDQEHVRLEVYDVMGRRVMVLQDGVQQPGWHNVHFNAGSLASGVYFYRLTAGDAMKVGRMTMIK